MSGTPPPAPATPTIAWLRPDQLGLVRAIAACAGLHITGAGSPDATASAAVAGELGAQTVTDLRAALATTPGGLVLLADAGVYASQQAHLRVDVEELDTARERGVKVASFEPLPVALTHLAALGRPVTAGGAGLGSAIGGPVGVLGLWCELLPLARFAPRVAELMELLEHIGPVRSLGLTVAGPESCGGLGARLVDALDLAQLLIGQAETAYAVYAHPHGQSALSALPGDDVRNLHGELAITLHSTTPRRADGAPIDADGRLLPGRATTAGSTASVLVSSRAGRYGVQLTAIGPRGRVSIDDDRLLWLDEQGRTPDGPESAARSGDDGDWGAHGFFVRLVSAQLRHYLQTGAAQSQRLDYPRTLAAAQACLLSAKTGEPERPATMLRLAGLAES